jgi:predicted HAD superfamily Cof-like phosphohydrolase
MSKTIEGVPDFLTREQYLAPLVAIGLDPETVLEVRYANDRVHAVVAATFPDGSRRPDPASNGLYKHRIFIPVRDDDADVRTTTIKRINTRGDDRG